MNVIVAAGVFDSPWLIAVIVLIGALSNWLMKRRRAEAPVSPNESQSPLSHGERQRPSRQPDLQDILRQLLGVEPSAAPTPPPIPRASRDFEGAEEPFRSERMSPNESPESYQVLPQTLDQAAGRSRRHTVAASAIPARVDADDRREYAVRRVVQSDGEARRPDKAVRSGHRRHSSAGKRAARLWHDRQIVQRAFVASLIFAHPKGLEA